MPEESSARTFVERDAPEAAAANVRDAVMAGEALVNERVVGVDQIEDAAVFADDGVEQQLGFTTESVAEIAVELLRDRCDVVELTQHQPLPGEIVDERAGALVSEHTAHLLLRSEALVNERVVGVDQIEDAAVFADDGVEQQLGFTTESVAEIAVELLRDRCDVVELTQHQPLPGEIVDERAGALVSEHTAHLLL